MQTNSFFKKIVLAVVYVIIYIALYIAIRILYDEYKTYGWDSVEIEQQTIDYINKNFTFDEIYFFSEIGFEDEGGNTASVKKFDSDTITYQVIGTPTESQALFLSKMVDTLNKVLLYNKIIEVGNKDFNANLIVNFCKSNDLKKISKNRYSDATAGYCIIKQLEKAVLKRAEIFILIDKQDQINIYGVILQEFTQSLGLFNDSERLKNTIFRDGYGLDSVYGPLDLACIKILYNSGIKPGVRLKTFENAMGIDYEQIAKEQTKKKKSIFEFN